MRLVLAAVALALCACEPRLPEGWPHTGDAGPTHITFTLDGGYYTLQVDATADKTWAALDFDVASEVPFEQNRWDLAFQRFHIRSRGGADGDGGVQVAVVYDAGFDHVTHAPMGPWLEDQPDGDDENLDPDTVFDKLEVWYDYEDMYHTLTPRPLVYVVRSDRGEYFKVQLDSYYDFAGTSAMLSLRYAPVAAH
jgi:hypothetical protein